MDSFEFTKIAGAVLSALLLIFGFKMFLEVRHELQPEAKPGYTLPGDTKAAEAKGDHGDAAKPADGKPAEAEKTAEAKPDAAKPADAGAAPAATGAGDAANGKTIASAKCNACHSFDNGGANKVGPNLWGVVGRKRAGHEGFGYSDAMKAKGGEWSADELAVFIKNPKGAVAGTKMVFNGIADDGERADLIAYLSTLK